MAKKTSTTLEVAGNPELDSTLPDVSLELNGATYHLLFNFAALSIAERKLAKAGVRISMLVARSIPYWDASNLPYIFFAALVTRHPELTFEQADALLDFENCDMVASKLVEAYQAALPEKRKKERPTEGPAATQ